MANQTVTTGTPAAPINYDDASISGLLNGETITINGGAVRVDADVRWNQQAAVMGAVTLSSTLGGSFVVDGSQVWEVPFSASTGNVPTQGALGANGVTGGTSGATGELTRVWATGSLDPAAAGGAMPATGFIKLRSKTGAFQNGETITLPGGATITASGAGKRSWIHVVGRSAVTGGGSVLTIPRLGSASFSGDWYELGTTNGADNQTFQYPVADQCPTIWIETAAGSGVYEIWMNAGVRWTDGLSAIATTDKRGTYFGCTNAGVITIAGRGAANVGLKPPSGCRVRIPNVILSNAEPTDYSVNHLPAGSASRYQFALGSAGGLFLSNVSSNWLHTSSGAYKIEIKDSGLNQPLQMNSVGTTIDVSNVGIAQVDSAANTTILVQTCYGGTKFTDVFAAKPLAAIMLNATTSSDIELTRVRLDTFGVAGSTAQPTTTNCFSIGPVINLTMTDCVAVGGVGLSLGAVTALIKNFQYAAQNNGTTLVASIAAPISIASASKDVVIDGFANFDNIPDVHTYGPIYTIGGNCDGIEIKNLGTPAAPYNMGSVNPAARVASMSGCRNIKMRRLYADNTRTALVSLGTSVQNVIMDNVWGDATDPQQTPANNMVSRGGRLASPTSGYSGIYGFHWMDAWTSTTAGYITIACNEPTDQTLNQCSPSLAVGAGSGFTGAGSVAMTKLTDTIEWTMPYYALGITAFQNVAPTITGTNAANHTIQFQWDTGAGWNGTWLALTGANLAGIGAINPATGIKLKVRATVNTASATNLLTYIRIDTVTDAVSQRIEYPLPGSIVTVNNLVPNSRVKITRVDTGAVLAQASSVTSTANFDLQYAGLVQIEARNASSTPAYKPWVTQTAISASATTTVTALQEAD
jgi:hypothetical protein